MASLSPRAIWNLSEEGLLDLLDSKILVKLPRRVQFYAPSFTYYKTAHFCSSSKDFPTISVTGSSCALNCKHCGGKVLETMHSADTPEKLLRLCAELKRNGAKGILVSGGCLPDGSVPLEKFIPVLAKIKNDMDITTFVHTGTLDFETAYQLKKAKIDAALIDIVGSDDTISEIYNLTLTTKDYAESLKALQQAGLNFVPHVITGLHHGKLKGELKALEMVAQYRPAAIVIISFMPIYGTAMAKTKPPAPTEIARTTATARAMFPNTPLVLGCMRPKKCRTETEVLAMNAGVDAMVFPSEEAIRYAEREGYKVAYSSYCCAQIYKDFTTMWPRTPFEV